MTSGEGGLLVTQDEHLYKRIGAVHDLGFARNDEGRVDPLAERYQLWGVGSRMSELSGAMALGQLRKVGQIIERMRTAKWKIRKGIRDIPGLRFRNIVDPAGDTGSFLITVYPSAENLPAIYPGAAGGRPPRARRQRYLRRYAGLGHALVFQHSKSRWEAFNVARRFSMDAFSAFHKVGRALLSS